ncbi:MAG: hypothetical protein GY851_13830 [bacterium]|nr:hypothetical protein [bacterium]
MPMRIIHTSDVLLDASYATVALPPHIGICLRNHLRDVIRRIALRARTWPADAVLVAGGLFAADYVMPDTISFLCQAFEELGQTPVFIASGRADPAVPGSPYLSRPWPGNVVLFSRSQWESRCTPAAPLTVHGFGFDTLETPTPDPSGLAVAQDDRIHLAVCPVSGESSTPTDAPRKGLRFVALGGQHRTQIVAHDQSPAVWYSGAPVGHGFDQTGHHHYLEIEIDGDHVRVNPVVSSRIVFEDHLIDGSTVDEAGGLADAVRALPHVEGAVRIARVLLSGIRGGESPRLETIRQALGENLGHLVLSDASGDARPHEAQARGPGPFNAFLSRLDSEIRDTSGPDRSHLLRRAREIGEAAFRGLELPIPAVEKDV